MSIQIYRDAENMIQGGVIPNGKKGKRDGFCTTTDRSKLPKPNKRVALSTISQNAGCRIQPSRAAKGKLSTIQTTCAFNVKPGFTIFTGSELPSQKESPMILSPALCDTSSFEEIQSELNVSTIEDIDQQSDPLTGVPEYATDIHTYLKKAELKFRPKSNYMRKQADINPSMRAILVDWLVEVAEEYKLKQQTLYLTVNYIDRFLSYMSVQRGKLQLVGAACMLVAAKFEEIYPPEVKEFVYITDDTFTSKQILRMEHLILKTLSFQLSVPTCKDFVTRYLVAAGATAESRLQFLSEYLCELVVIDNDASVNYLPSMIAAAAIYMANMTLNLGSWSRSLEFYTDYKLVEICQCVKDLHSIYKASAKHPQQAIQLKYKSPKFGCVSELTPPVDLNMLDQFG